MQDTPRKTLRRPLKSLEQNEIALHRVIADTNIFISGLLNRKGLPAKFIELWDEGKFDIVMSQPIYNEIEEVLNRFNRISFEVRQELLSKIRANAEWLTEIPLKVDIIKDDEKDNMFLECAIASEVKYIVSGDHHLLNLGEYQKVKIIKVREFLRLFGSGKLEKWTG